MHYVKSHIGETLLIINYLMAIAAAVTIILKNTNPTKTLSYLLLLVALPFVGLLVYYFFGREYRKGKLFRKKSLLDQQQIKAWKEALVIPSYEFKKIEESFLEDKIKLIKLLYRSEEAPLTLHNKVSLLLNGDKKFQSLFNDIENAQKYIHVEYYIIKDDTIGSQLIALLCKKAREGVKVRLSYDYVGSSLSSKAIKMLTEAGVEHFPFMPVYFPRFASKFNYRNHRKIVVIDGVIGYLGGINVSDRYINFTKGVYWRDTHMRIEGEAVGSMQLHFLLNWEFLTDYTFEVQEDYFPKHVPVNKTQVQIAASGPDSDWANIMEAIFTAINTADDYVYITTPYFIPNDEILMAIVTAAKGGVAVKLIIPKKSDSRAAQYATFSYVETLLEAGVEVYLYKKGFVHAKTMVIDDVFSTIGTSNMDYRSFHINFEINALVYDVPVAKEMATIFNEDLKDCEKVTLEAWQQRALSHKLKESFYRLWAPLL